MKVVSPELAAHLAGEETTVSTCVRVRLTNGTIYGFTSHDQVIFLSEGGSPNVIRMYQAGAYTPTDVETTAALNVDNLEVHGMLQSSTIDEGDLHAGLWDYADVQIFEVNYTDLSQGILHQRVGTLGEVSLDRNIFRAEVRGLMQAYSRINGQLTQPGCRYIFGDSRCKVLLAPVTFAVTVGSVDADNIVITFQDALTDSPPAAHPPGFYDYGLARFVTGLNAGLAMEIKNHYVVDSPPISVIRLQLPMPYPISADSPPDMMELVKGCGKTPAHCKENNNYLNFGGEPDLPGGDRIVQIGRPGK